MLSDGSCHGIKHFNRLDFIAKKMNLKGVVSIARKNINNIAVYAKIAMHKICSSTCIKALYQLMQEFCSRNNLINSNVDDIFFKLNGISNAIQARNRRNNNNIATARKQRRCGTKP